MVMSKERELLRRMTSHSCSVIPSHFIDEIQELLAQPEQESFFHYECTEIADVFDVFKTASYERIMTVQGKHNLDLLLQMLDSSPTLGLQMLDTNLWSALRIREPEQEPAAWLCPEYGFLITDNTKQNGTHSPEMFSMPLYTAPPKREALSKAEIFNAWIPSKATPCVHSFKAGVRFAEKHFGITGVDDEC
jgi:hypothetical protein